MRIHWLVLLLFCAGLCQADQSLKHRLLTDLMTRHQADQRDLRGYYRLASLQRHAKRQALGARTLAALNDIKFETLSSEGRIDYLLCQSWLAGQADGRSREEDHRKRSGALLPFLEQLIWLERFDRHSGKDWPLRELARRLTKLSADVEQAQKQAKAAIKTLDRGGPYTDVAQVRWVVEQLTIAEKYLKGWYESNRETAPGFRWWVAKPYGRCHKALVAYRKLLGDKIIGKLKQMKGKNLFAVGRARMARSLELAFQPLTPESLLALGQRMFGVVEAQIKHQAGLIDPAAKDWKVVLERIKQDTVAPGKQRAYVTAVGREALAFVTQKKLVRVPQAAAERWYLSQISAKQQKRFPFAFYSGLRMGVAYARSGQSHSGKLGAMRGNNRYFTRTVVPHELIPGHHLQRWYAARHRTWRGRFSTPFLVEGWGLYTELLLAEHGFFRNPRERMGHLFWKLLRAARILVSTRYHLGQIKQAEMVEFMVERVGLEKQGALAEVERYMTYSPLYQAAYMVGGLQILALRKACRKRWGKQFSLMRFHDALLQQGAIPIKLIGYALLGDKVPYKVPLTAAAAPKKDADSSEGKFIVGQNGLKLMDLVVGKGQLAVRGMTLRVHYSGQLPGGKVFDTSRKAGRGPFSFTLGAGMVIKGWDLGLVGMRVGGKRRLVIPPSLGYGAKGAGGVIPPNATLIFDVELLGVGK